MRESNNNRILLGLLIAIGFMTSACAQPLPEEKVSYVNAASAYRNCQESYYPVDRGAECDSVRPTNNSLSFNEWSNSSQGARRSNTSSPSFADQLYSPTETWGTDRYMNTALEYEYMRLGYEAYLESLDQAAQQQWDPYYGYY